MCRIHTLRHSSAAVVLLIHVLDEARRSDPSCSKDNNHLHYNVTYSPNVNGVIESHIVTSRIHNAYLAPSILYVVLGVICSRASTRPDHTRSRIPAFRSAIRSPLLPLCLLELQLLQLPEEEKSKTTATPIFFSRCLSALRHTYISILYR